MKQKLNYGSHGQQGIALPIIMVILLLAALVTLYTANTSVKEQQVTADHYRSEQAFSTAQAGVEVALERHNNFEDYPGPGTPEDDIYSTGLSKGLYKVMFCDIWDDAGDEAKSAELMADFSKDTDFCAHPINTVTVAEPDGFRNDERVGILSVGKPDDASGRRTVSAVSAPATLFSDDGPPDVPLTARGELGLGANITVINRYSNITVWTGKDLDAGSAAISTYIYTGSVKLDRQKLIKKPGATPGACIELDALDYASLASCDQLGNNADILEDDANLINISAEEMFQRIFSLSKIDVKQMAKLVGQFYPAGTAIPTPPEYLSGLIWKEAADGETIDLFVGNLDDQDAPPTYENDAPAFLVIDVRGGGTVQIRHGDAFAMVFLFGNVEFTGNPDIIGSMIVTGTVGGTGRPIIIHDKPGISVNPEGLGGLRGIEPGTWKDWGWDGG